MDDQPPAWFTEGRRGTFKIGDEVVVVLSECKIGQLHGTQEQQARGIVIDLDGIGSPAPDTHSIVVWFTPALVSGAHHWYYAASELRPFDLQAHIAAIIGD